VCAAIFFALPLVTFVFGVRPTAFENRALTAFPNPGQGWQFFGQLSPWATDHLPFRQGAINAGAWLSQGVFGELPSYNGNGLAGGPVAVPQPAGPLPAATSPPPALSEFPAVLQGTDGWLYLGADLANHCDPTQPIDQVVAELNRLRDGIVKSGRKFVVVISPDKATVVPQYLPPDFPGRACHAAGVTQFWHAMDALPYVLDVRTDLQARGLELGAPVYGPQDGHWSDEGGVIMAERLAEQLRPGITSSWRVVPGQKWTVPADLPPLIDRTGTTGGMSYSIMPDGTTNLTFPQPTDYVTAPLHFDSATGIGTYGPGVAMLADSFTIRATKYLASAFGNLTIMQTTDVDHDQGAQVTKTLEANSVVVVEVAERTLVSGTYDLLTPDVEDTILAQLAVHPVH
jgi:hypothetical protein